MRRFRRADGRAAAWAWAPALRRRGLGGPAGLWKVAASYHAHSRVATHRRYTVPSGRPGTSCIDPQNLHRYKSGGMLVPPYKSFVPLICSLNSQPNHFAARRHITMRGRKISKYSITCERRVSIVSSRVIVRAPSSTRRNECWTA
jgi:hypothetical protein